MKFFPYRITEKKQAGEDTFIFRVVPHEGDFFPFVAGQYCYILNEDYTNPTEPHPFSIASSPLNTNYLEFCIKVYGKWTQALAKKSNDETLLLSKPQGSFIWDSSITYAVFLSGGIGISPIMSILRMLSVETTPIPLTLLYGNRTPQTIVYKKTIEQLSNTLSSFKIVNILSDVKPTDGWKGYRGFITKDILVKEVDFEKNPTFFLVGPPIFIEKMQNILIELSVNLDHIKKELLTFPPSPK